MDLNVNFNLKHIFRAKPRLVCEWISGNCDPDNLIQKINHYNRFDKSASWDPGPCLKSSLQLLVYCHHYCCHHCYYQLRPEPPPQHLSSATPSKYLGSDWPKKGLSYLDKLFSLLFFSKHFSIYYLPQSFTQTYEVGRAKLFLLFLF